MTAASEEVPVERSTLKQRWIDLLVIVPTVAAGLAGVRIYIFANGDVPTMRYLIQALDLQSLLLSSVTPMILPIALILLSGLIAHRLRIPSRSEIAGIFREQGGVARLTAPTIVVVAWYFVALRTPFWIVIAYTLMGAYYGHMLRPLSVTQLKSRRFLSLVGKQSWPLWVFAIFVSLSAGPSWIPAETAKIGESSSISVIYNLDMKEDQATILNRTEGTVQILPVTDIHERKTCDDSSPVGPPWASRPFREILGGDRGLMRHPACPSTAQKSPDRQPQVTPTLTDFSSPSHPVTSPTSARDLPSPSTSLNGSASTPASTTSRRP